MVSSPPGVSSGSTVPPIASARPLDTTSPSPIPVPSPGQPSRWKGRNARFLSASEMPVP
jgi:hypothetical protein